MEAVKRQKKMDQGSRVDDSFMKGYGASHWLGDSIRVTNRHYISYPGHHHHLTWCVNVCSLVPGSLLKPRSYRSRQGHLPGPYYLKP